MSTTSKKHSHYFKSVKGLPSIDVYRVLALFTVNDPCIQHAVKKLLVAGGRGAGKDVSKDIQEAIDSLVRWQDMREEEKTPEVTVVNLVAEIDTRVKVTVEDNGDRVIAVCKTPTEAADAIEKFFTRDDGMPQTPKREFDRLNREQARRRSTEQAVRRARRDHEAND